MIKLFKSKKSVLFTLAAVLLSTMLYSFFSQDQITPAYYEYQPINARIQVMDNYIKSFQEYLGQGIEISSYAALESIYEEYASNGTFFANNATFASVFNDCVKCGTNCAVVPDGCSHMPKIDLETFITNMTTIALEDLNLKTIYVINSVEARQSRPDEVEVSLNISFFVTDFSASVSNENFASWNATKVITKSVSILGQMDPTIGINTVQGYENNITLTNVCVSNESCWNLTSAKSFYDEHSYTFTDKGTSYLQRFWNDPTASTCCGIESFLDVSEVSGNNSYVDHYYYTGNYTCLAAGPNRVKLFKLDEIDTGFLIDEATAVRYHLIDVRPVYCQYP